MIEYLRKPMLMGLGLAFLTKDKIEEMANDLAEKGDLSKKDVRAFVEDLSSRSEEAKKKVEQRVEKIVKKTLEKMNLVSRDEFLELEEQVRRLKQDRAAH